MSKHYRIVLAALGIGLLLALAVIFFIPEQLPGGTGLLTPSKTSPTATAPKSNADILKDIDQQMAAVEQEYNFNVEPAPESLQSPDFTTSTAALH